MIIREATLDDARILANHHRKMFEEICQQKGIDIDTELFRKLETAYLEKISKQIPEKNCKAWVIFSEAEIVASGAITIVALVPVPFDLNSKIAYLHSMYTEKAHRGKKFASKIVDRALRYCRDNRIHRIQLNATRRVNPSMKWRDLKRHRKRCDFSCHEGGR